MLYIHEPTETYPCNDRSIRDMNPNVSFPAVITLDIASSFGFLPVIDVDPPVATSTQRLGQGKPHKREDGAWYQTWSVVDFNEEEIATLTLSVKEQKKQQIDTKRDTLLKGGYHFAHEEQELTLQTRDDEDRINWLGILNAATAMIMAGAGDSPTKIRTAENVTITITFSQAQLLMLQTLNYQSSLYSSAWDHKDALELLTTLEEVTTYDVESDWPS